METIFINTEISEEKEPDKFVLNLLLRIGLRNFKQTCCKTCLFLKHKKKKKKSKIRAPTQNEEFELFDGSCSV